MSRTDAIKTAEGVWQTREQYPRLSHQDLKRYIGEINNSFTKRARICMHQNTDDRMQEMFIAFDGAGYVRPSHHLNRDESFHMVVGFGLYLFYDENGTQINDVRLGNYESGMHFYCRIPGNIDHSLVLYSDYAVAHEVCTGPFDKSTTRFPSWSPEYQSAVETQQFSRRHAAQVVRPALERGFERVSEDMYRAQPGVVSIKRSDIDYLKANAWDAVRHCIRLCINQSDDDLLQEMFVVRTRKRYIRVKKYIGRDKSLHILEGDADLIFFDEIGNIVDAIHLSANSPNKNFFARVPKDVFHAVIMKSEVLVIHEATPGPFNREETLWAQWSPLESDLQAVATYSRDLERRLDIFRINSQKS
jgi:cupin fold WbuC family metalloprotein